VSDQLADIPKLARDRFSRSRASLGAALDACTSRSQQTHTHQAEREEVPMSETRSEYNAKIIAEFRTNGGRVGGMWEDIPLLLLHHTGAKSGVRRVNPVAYLPNDRGYLIWAANGGAPNNPDWYHNLGAQPSTRIEVGTDTIDVVAEEATGEERERLFTRAAERYPQLTEAASKTQRVIPMIVLTPRGSD
jgi:deazaflavin-dependent oxidoreductase (nitroreductase family)